MGVVCVQSQQAGASAKVGALQAHLGAAGVDTASVSGKLPKLAGSAGLAQRVNAGLTSRLSPLVSHGGTSAQQLTAVTASLGVLRASLQVESANLNHVSVVVSLGALLAAGAVSATGTAHGASGLPLSAHVATGSTQQALAASRLGGLTSALYVQSANLNHVTVVTYLGALHSTASASSAGTAHGSSRIAVASQGTTTAGQAAHAASALVLTTVLHTTSLQSVARITATLGALTSRLTSQPPPAGYAADGNYYIALPARPFLASLQARAFYAPVPARSFYVLTDPDMTPLFDTLDPRETLVLTLDASADLAAGETLTAITAITALQQSGVPGALPTLTGQVVNAQPVTLSVAGKPVTIAAGCGVQVIVTGGISGCRYLISAVCATSNPDKVLTLKGVLPVSAS